MEIKKENVHNAFSFLVTNISCSLFQIIILIFMSVLQFCTWYFSGNLIWAFSGNSQFASDVSPIISYIIIAIIYGAIWLIFWSLLFNDGIKWFYYKIAFSIIPLVLALFMFNPIPNPMAMIPMPTEPVFSCLVTGIILLPIYSTLIYKFILQTYKHKLRNTIVLCCVMLSLGSLIFVWSWSMIHIIYRL